MCECEGCAQSGRVCMKSAKNAANFARETVKVMLSDSSFFSDQHQEIQRMDGCKIPLHRECQYGICRSKLTVGKMLGRGGFADVFECSLREAKMKSKLAVAIKFLRRPVLASEKLFVIGTADIVKEAHFLAAFDHNNILKLRGITAGVPLFNPTSPEFEQSISGQQCYGDIFILMDKINETLESRFSFWVSESRLYKQSEKCGGFIFQNVWSYKQKSFLMERLRVASELASALQYLHEKNIIYRDIKKGNIGFDSEGTLKLFDFGLARELKMKDMHTNCSTYNLTGKTGSMRYMAPEIALNKSYNLSADVYSYGILVWELCYLRKAFEGMGVKAIEDKVVREGLRPKLEKLNYVGNEGNLLRQLLEQCWSSDITERPTFTEILSILRHVEFILLKQDIQGHSASNSMKSRLQYHKIT